ncbi:phenylalanine--tRNA ligase subunit beta [[Eubacterium] cellulosolvens]
MPTVETSITDLEGLVGKPLPREIESLNDILAYVKGEVGSLLGDELSIEIKDSNNPDIWSGEGIARALKGFFNIEIGLKQYRSKASSKIKLIVDQRLRSIRPYLACSAVKNVNLTDVAIKGMMHLQDKLDQTYGRERKRTSIGLYVLDLIKPPIYYTVSKPQETRFTPLGFDRKLNLEEILIQHPKGQDYGHIVNSYPVWPILKDSLGQVLSFPPIINSNDLGKVTAQTRNILIEVTGTTEETVLDALTIITIALADRGGEIYSTEIQNPFSHQHPLITPNLKTFRVKLKVPFIHKVIGLPLSLKDLQRLLERARYRVLKTTGEEILVEVPCYRKDIMHPIDVIEDVVIALDVNKIETRWPPFNTVGGLKSETEKLNKIRELSVGLGFQEALTFNMTSPTKLYTQMNLPLDTRIEISNPKMMTLTCLRTWLIPSLIEFVSVNTHHEYPQKIFEAGDCMTPSKNKEGIEETKNIAYLIAHHQASFTQIKSVLEAFMLNVGLSYKIAVVNHDSFIEGRVGRVIIEGGDAGVIGEIHPQVLENWKVEMPTAALELNLTKIFTYQIGE